MARRLVLDLDATIALRNPGDTYEAAQPDLIIVEKMREYQKAGFEIVIFSARNMNSHSNNVGKITAKTVPVIIKWLDQHSVPYDEIFIGKPWCGTEGFYVDDRAIRPSEFKALSFEEIGNVLSKEIVTYTEID